MKKLSTLLVVAGCAATIATSAASSAGLPTVTVAMKDPGCHWFLVAGKYKTHLSVAGPVSLSNLDEAALKIAGPNGVQVEKVGKHLALKAGTYRITMVGQAPDDNHLVLVVK
jgi:hypothetical protein